MPAPRIFLVRHGDTAWTEAGRHTGLTDIPLSPGGETKACALAPRLAGIPFARVFTSPLARAKRTCELTDLGASAKIDNDLVEWNYGRYEGLTSAQIREQNPAYDLFTHGCPEGESPNDVAVRADRVLARLLPLEGDTAVFSSGHFIRMLAARWLAQPAATAKGFYTATASVGILGYEHGVADRVILLWNDTRI